MPTIKLSTLNYDPSLPHFMRTHIDQVHVGHIAEGLRSGHDVPALLVDRKTREVVDGFHSALAWERIDPDSMVPVEYKSFSSTKDKILEVARRNRNSKKALNNEERCLLVIAVVELGGDEQEATEAVGWTYEKLLARRTMQARERGTHHPIPVKEAAAPYGGRIWTKREAAVAKKLSNPAVTHFLQLWMHLEHFGVEGWNEEQIAQLRRLPALVESTLAEIPEVIES